MKYVGMFLVAFGVLWGIWVILLTCRRGHPAWETLRKFRYAHRGYHHKPTVPENSMAAFRQAVERGWGAELDVHLMKDGNLAVIHDSSLKRTAGADVEIEDLTKEDLPRYTLEESEEHIPLLEEVLALFCGKAPLIIELKAARGNHAALSEAVAKLPSKVQYGSIVMGNATTLASLLTTQGSYAFDMRTTLKDMGIELVQNPYVSDGTVYAVGQPSESLFLNFWQPISVEASKDALFMKAGIAIRALAVCGFVWVPEFVAKVTTTA